MKRSLLPPDRELNAHRKESLAEPTTEANMIKWRGMQSSSAQQCANALGDHCRNMKELPGCRGIFKEIDWRSLISRAAETMQDGLSVKWFAEHSCAVVAFGVASVPEGPLASRYLSVVGLDEWRLEAQWKRSPSGSGSVQRDAIAGGASVSPAGSVPEEDLNALFSRLSKLIEEANLKRRSSGGKKCQQQTPATIASLLCYAKSSVLGGSARKAPEFLQNTSVDETTARSPSDTAWPLAREVFQVILRHHVGGATMYARDDDPGSAGLLSQLVVVDLQVSMVEKCLNEAMSGSADHVNEAMAMLKSSARLVDELVCGEHSMEACAGRIKAVREGLDEAEAKRSAEVAARWRLPQTSASPQVLTKDSVRLPVVALPPLSQPKSRCSAGSAMSAWRTLKNLSFLPPLHEADRYLTSASLESISAWVGCDGLASGKGLMANQLVLKEVETLFFRTASHESVKAAAESFKEGDIAKLTQLVENYRSVVASVVRTAPKNAIMLVELRSRETLVCWIAYSLAFSAACFEWPVAMETYGVSLRADDLRHLVLSDILSVDAALKTADYLRKHSRKNRAIFTLVDDGRATFGLAEQVARRSAHLEHILAKEKNAAQARVKGHWEEVQRRQDTRAGLRRKITTLQIQLSEREIKVTKRKEIVEESVGHARRYSAGCHRLRSRCFCSPCARLAEAERAVAETKENISTANRERQAIETVNPVQPLPEDETAALTVLFFLHMPSTFRMLSRLSFEAQQMLLPPGWDSCTVKGAVEVPPCGNRWSSHYNSRQSSEYHSQNPPGLKGVDGDIMLGYLGTIGTPETMVDLCATPSDGVWYPDVLAPGCMVWRGGGFGADRRSFDFNPFSVKLRPEWTVVGFTEKLDTCDPGASLQWALPQYGIDETPPERGNLSLASQCDAPDWLSKTGYLAYGTLRAYPLLQLRKLALNLRDRSLPLDRPEVRTLVLQALYHIGDISSTSPATLLWRHDHDDVFPALCEELEVYIEEVQHTPREHRVLQLLAAICCYVSEWHDKCNISVRPRLARICRQWAADVELQIEEALARQAGSRIVSSLKAKQCMYFMYGVLSFDGSRALSADDVSVLCELVTQAHSRWALTEETALGDEIAGLHGRCVRVMAGRCCEIVEQARNGAEFISTAVGRVLEGIPSSLSWTAIAGTTACFEAKWDGHVYSVNLLSGVVLYDGLPPGLLPDDIVQTSRFREVFGRTNFEVTTTLEGVYRTARTVSGCFYEFFVQGSEDVLTVEEIEQESGDRLRLLDRDGAWAAEMPTRLRKMHSQWACYAQRAIVFRPKSFRGREADFVVRISGSEVSATCYRVPQALRSRKWKSLLEDAESMCDNCDIKDMLVLLPERHTVLSALEKFERPDFIHMFLQLGGRLLIELPRFGLEFEVMRSSDESANGEGSGIWSLNHRGFQLDCAQQMGTTLPGILRYLVLDPLEKTDSKLVVVPRGKVVVVEGDAKRRVEIQCREDRQFDGSLEVFCYQLHHRWKQLVAIGISARLQLAAMYAGSGTLLPDVLAGMTGCERAMQLVRRCFVNHPLEVGDREQLKRVIRLSGSTPALALLCVDLLSSSGGFNFLHGPDDPPTSPVEIDGVDILTAAGIAYVSKCSNSRRNWRQRLTAAEELRILGALCPASSASTSQHPSIRRKYGSVNLLPCPITPRDVGEFEERLLQMKDTMAGGNPADFAMQPYPLGVPGADALTQEMHAELAESWVTHRSSPPRPPLLCRETLQLLGERFESMYKNVSTARTAVEEFLIEALASTGCRLQLAWHQANTAAALLPCATTEDLPPLLWERDRIRDFNPFLSEAASGVVEEAIVSWLRLCVLEDKLNRLCSWVESEGSEANLLGEIEVYRAWDPAKHPEWLAFEADAGLQIRPRQAEVALHMIANPGDIVQLNMGEGKTRVILPLLMLYWGKPSDSEPVLRLNFLGALIGEAFDYLHHALSAGVLARPLFLMPFNRDVNLTLANARALRGGLERCRREGRAMLMTPEHRQSLYLKEIELRDNDPEVSHELRKATGMPFRDVLDESDELLHHRKLLVYAIGKLEELPDQAPRAHAVQALLRALKHRDRHASLAKLISDPAIALEGASNCTEQFAELRLVQGPALDSISRKLRLALVDAVVKDPPYEMLWLRNMTKTQLTAIIDLVVVEGVGAEEAFDKDLLEQESDWGQLLAFRGLLAHGIFIHCLQMRPRVDYGVSRSSQAKKRLAIPFRASNTPADRSEWKQPDVAIVLTTLSYYYDGLSPAQVREALTTLLDMAESARADFYDSWLAESESRLAEEDLVKLDDVGKVDLSNDPQMELLFEYFGKNFEVINFWLNFVVLPAETKLCPEYISTNSWFLADNPVGAITGFSGTNDNHRLLPLQVRKPRDGCLQLLSGTNGKMLQMILNNDRYVTLQTSAKGQGSAAARESWETLLLLAVEEKADVLVDCGALLGRISIKEAAMFLMSPAAEMSSKFRGVVFFDPERGTAAGGGEWTVLDRLGSFTALSASPIRASEAFAIYDEARCRGSDLKLAGDAKALLTIGPKNGKDKVMQAAGRLRRLGRSKQSIVFVGTGEVTSKIVEVTGTNNGEVITSKHVLGYIMANTVDTTRSGLLQWAHQGQHFLKTYGRPERAKQNEVLRLDEAYGPGCSPTTVAATVSAMAGKLNDVYRDDLHEPELLKVICTRASLYGSNVMVSRASSLAGECERETELEVVEEQEVERQVARALPREEKDWTYAAVLSVETLGELVVASDLEVKSLESVYEDLPVEAQVSSISSTVGNVSCSLNFLFGTTASTGLNEYLRPVDAALMFKSGQMLLLSEREANGVLQAMSMRGNRPIGTMARLVHISYTASAPDDAHIVDNPLMRIAVQEARHGGSARLPSLASVWVFAGRTMIPEDGREAVKTLVKRQKSAVAHILAMRGKQHMLPRSDLERLLIG